LAARWAALRILWRLTQSGFDWLLLSNPSLDGLAYAAVAKGRGAKVAATYDDLRARLERPSVSDRLRLLWLKAADAIIPRITALNITTSHFLRKIIERIAPATPTFILPPLVDTDTFKERPGASVDFRSRWSLRDSPVISYLGTYWCVEGLAVLIEAASRLVQAGDEFRLVISGAPHQGLDCDSVSNLMQFFDVQDVVVETGWLPTTDVVGAMSAADILVIPKLDDVANKAGMPAKLAEYLAMGRAVVVSKVGEIPLYVRDRSNAILCEPGDVVSLTAALRELLHNSALRHLLASNARDAAKEHFDYRPIIGRLAERMTELRRK